MKPLSIFEPAKLPSYPWITCLYLILSYFVGVGATFTLNLGRRYQDVIKLLFCRWFSPCKASNVACRYYPPGRMNPASPASTLENLWVCIGGFVLSPRVPSFSCFSIMAGVFPGGRRPKPKRWPTKAIGGFPEYDSYLNYDAILAKLHSYRSCLPDVKEIFISDHVN